MEHFPTLDGSVIVVRSLEDRPECAVHQSITATGGSFDGPAKGPVQYFCSDCGEPLTHEQVKEIISRQT